MQARGAALCCPSTSAICTLGQNLEPGSLPQDHPGSVCVCVCVCVCLGREQVYLLCPALNMLPLHSSSLDGKTSRTALLFLRSFLSTAFLALFLSRGSQNVCVCVCVTPIHFNQSNSIHYDTSPLYNIVRTVAMFGCVCVCVCVCVTIWPDEIR